MYCRVDAEWRRQSEVSFDIWTTATNNGFVGMVRWTVEHGLFSVTFTCSGKIFTVVRFEVKPDISGLFPMPEVAVRQKRGLSDEDISCLTRLIFQRLRTVV